jgi:hypothetical protein
MNSQLNSLEHFRLALRKINIDNFQAELIVKKYITEYHFSDLDAEQLTRYFYYCNKDPSCLFFKKDIKTFLVDSGFPS